MKGTLFPRTSFSRPGRFVSRLWFMLNSVAILELRNVARSTKWISSGVGLFYLAVLISRLVGALPASCGLIGLNLEMKSPPRDLMHGGPFKPQLGCFFRFRFDGR